MRRGAKSKAERRELIERERIFAVLRADDGNKAVEAARAAIKGGIKIIQIALNTRDALKVIGELRGEKGVLLGAGSVRTVKASRAAAKAGARFIVSPHFDGRIVTSAKKRGIICVPGVATATEAVEARERGADFLKVFPAHLLGGVDFIKALLAPLPELPLVVSGGVTPKNIKEYLASGAKAVAVGEAIFKKTLMLSKNYKGITAAAEHLAELAAEAGKP